MEDGTISQILAKHALKKWKNNDAEVLSPCPFCKYTKILDEDLNCNICRLEKWMCHYTGLSGLVGALINNNHLCDPTMYECFNTVEYDLIIKILEAMADGETDFSEYEKEAKKYIE